MIDVVLDTLIDGVKLIPFLFVAFLLIEFLEHKLSDKQEVMIKKAGRFGPILGGILGIIPQCGFSVMATNLYVTRIITVGTLVSIYLSTSDEMIPILISENADISIILKILVIKMTIGIISGFIIDFILRKKEEREVINYDMCSDSDCHCEEEDGILIPSIKHTFNTMVFIFIITFILNILMYFVGEDLISKIFMKDNILAPFVASLIGLIPNCGASVMITELYLNDMINLSSCIAGLLTGSGVALLVLFKQNKDRKDSIKILLTIYLIGALVGILINILGINI